MRYEWGKSANKRPVNFPQRFFIKTRGEGVVDVSLMNKKLAWRTAKINSRWDFHVLEKSQFGDLKVSIIAAIFPSTTTNFLRNQGKKPACWCLNRMFAKLTRCRATIDRRNCHPMTNRSSRMDLWWSILTLTQNFDRKVHQVDRQNSKSARIID